MQKNILITTNNGLSSKFLFHTVCDIAESLYKENKNNKVYFLSHYSSKDRVLKLFKRENRAPFFDEIILSKDFTNDLDYSIYENWLEAYNKLDITSLPVFDEIIEVGSALSEGGKLRFGVTNFDNLFMSKAHFNFISIKKLKENILLAYKIASTQNIKLRHFIIDPQEVNYNDFNFNGIEYERFFPYTSTKFDFNKHNAFLNSYIGRTSSDSEKEFDFVFGYTILTKDRTNSADYLNEVLGSISNLRTKIFLRDKYNNIDTFIKKDEYLDYIKKSRFTLIIPSYNKETFSAFRYIESIYSGCVPLILDTVDISEAKNSLYIPDELIVSAETILNTINTIKCDELLLKIKDKLEND